MSAGLALSRPKEEVSLFYAPPEERGCHRGSFALLSFLPPSLSLSRGNANTLSISPHLYFKRFLPGVNGLGRIREGWMNGNAFLHTADRRAVVFSAFIIHQLLKLFNPRARLL